MIMFRQSEKQEEGKASNIFSYESFVKFIWEIIIKPDMCAYIKEDS